MIFGKKETLWQQYGKWIIGSVLIIAVAYGGVQYYQSIKAATAAKASILYDQMIMHAYSKNPEDEKKAKQEGESLINEYKETPYAALAALVLAKISLEKNDPAAANRYFEIVIKDNKEPMQPIAVARYAKVLGEEKKYREALDILTAIDAEGYESLFTETKGDIYLMQGEKDKAKEAYELAVKSLPPGVPASRLEIKLAELGIIGEK